MLVLPPPGVRESGLEHVGAATIFHLRLPYLEQGGISEYRAAGDAATVMIKNYASGGENRMHSHPDEEHCFVVLEGEATFYIGVDEISRIVRPMEGVFLARGAPYRFQNSSESNLIMVRFGAQWPDTPVSAQYPDGTIKTGRTEPLARVAPVVRPGAGFAGFEAQSQ